MSQQSVQEGLSIGGRIEQDIANFLGPYYQNKEIQKGITNARSDIGKAYDESRGYIDPYYRGGMQDYQSLRDAVSSGEYNVSLPNYQQTEQQPEYQNQNFNFQFDQNDPSYKFRLQEGLNAINSSASARGNLLSSTTLKNLQRYSSDLASQEYSNAYNRYSSQFNSDRNAAVNIYGQNLGQFNSNRNFGYGQSVDRYNMANQQANNAYTRQSNLAGYGQTAASNLSNLAYGHGENLANLSMGSGVANANKWLGYQNAAVGQGEHLMQSSGGDYGVGKSPSSGSGGSSGGMSLGNMSSQFGGTGEGSDGNDFGGEITNYAGSAYA
jgi:hypothetical protein